MRGVQLLGVGGVAQEFPQPGRLRAGRAEGVQHLRRRSGAAGGPPRRRRPACRRCRWCGRPCSASGRGIRRRGCRPRSPRRWPPAGRAPLSAHGLRHRQRRREHHRGGVEHRAVVHVVLLGEVRGRGVDHGRQQRAGAAAVDQHLADGPSRRAHALRRSASMALHRPRALAGQRRAEPVEQQVFGAAQHRRRECRRSAGRRRSAARVGRVGRRWSLIGVRSSSDRAVVRPLQSDRAGSCSAHVVAL